MVRLSDYKFVFGMPGEGVHAYRLLGLAAVDVGLTLGAAVAVSYAAGLPLWQTVLGAFGLGVAAHWLFGVPTAANVALGL